VFSRKGKFCKVQCMGAHTIWLNPATFKSTYDRWLRQMTSSFNDQNICACSVIIKHAQIVSCCFVTNEIYACLNNYTPRALKTCHFIFDYNSCISWSIFWMNILQLIKIYYVVALWYRSCDILKATKVYFRELHVKIKYVKFENNFH